MTIDYEDQLSSRKAELWNLTHKSIDGSAKRQNEADGILVDASQRIESYDSALQHVD